MATAAALRAIAVSLNERQRAYLLTTYTKDQEREAANRGPRGLPAREYRWIEYGPVDAQRMDNSGNLRWELDRAGLVDRGTGATWAALEQRGLLVTRDVDSGFIDTRTGRRITVMQVRLTTDGRKVARIIKGEPLTRPKQVKPLSLSALPIIAFGQAYPDNSFRFHDPWEPWRCPLDYLIVLGICRGLIKHGLLSGDPPNSLKITQDGMAFDVTKEPNWKPDREGRPTLGD